MAPTTESDPNVFSSAAEIETKKEMKEDAPSKPTPQSMPSTVRIVGRDLQSRHAPFYPPSHTSFLGFRMDLGTTMPLKSNPFLLSVLPFPTAAHDDG